MIGFNDIFKSSFLNSVSSFSVTDTLIALLLAFVIGLFITWVYKKTFSGVMFSSSFCTTLMGLSVVTTFVILAVTSNVVLSLGMVGALSIVRFRTAIKEPLDIVFLFWSLAVGIVLGAGLIPLAFLGSIIIGVILLVFANRKGYDSPYIVVISCEDAAAEEASLKIVSDYVKKYKIKSKTVNKNGIELTVEIRLHENESEFVNKISGLEHVKNVVLVTYNGDYMN
jgi:uncharacterized membrane protein YhiD involved in acid resistance